MSKLLKLPVGIESFSEIRTEGLYYIDKTSLIEHLINDSGEVNLFTRPRRFGKTLNMSMLKSFFETGADKSLFEGLYIADKTEICEKYLGKFPVIFLTLKGVEGLSFKEAYDMFVRLIGEEAEKFDVLYESDKLSEADKDDYRSLAAKKNGRFLMDEVAFKSSLKILSRLLYKHYGQKTIILIDEYDVPLDKAYQNGYYREMVMLMRAIFGAALKTNEYLQFAVLTGCLRISKESIFTGLNNFRVHSVTNTKFDEEFGFTDAEVKTMFAYYGIECRLEEAKAWYDGYHFGNADVYCPWDVINFVSDAKDDFAAKPQAYWINSSGNGLLKRLIDKANVSTRSDIEKLIAGETIERELHEELTYDEIEDSIDNIWSVLFTTGYLTTDGTGETNHGTYRLRLPNEELRVVFKRQVLEWIKKSIRNSAGTEPLKRFWEDFAKGNAEAVEKYINNMLSRSISVFDVKGEDIRRESTYHMVIMTLFASNPEWNTQSNVEAREGFADIVVETDDIDAGIVVELKYARESEGLEPACRAAINQIKDKRYYEYLYNEERTDVLLYGIAFCKKRCRVRLERLA